MTKPKPKKENSKKAVAKRPAKKKKVRYQDDDEFASGAAEDVKKVLKRSSKNNAKSENNDSSCVPYVTLTAPSSSKDHTNRTTVTTSTYSICNPKSYYQLVSKVEDKQANKPAIPSTGQALDTLWQCVLCQRGSNVSFLGDLFGPYYMTSRGYPELGEKFPLLLKKSPSSTTSSPTHASSSAKKFTVKRSTSSKLVKQENPESASTSAQDATTNEKSSVYTDMWFHGDCAIWAPGLYLKGFILCGCEENLPDFWDRKCNRCHKVGASVGCCAKNCQKVYHFPCAQEAGCQFFEETLTAKEMKQLAGLLPYFACGSVVRGFGRGSKSLGCPTANLPQYVVDRLPAEFPSGVFFGYASVNNGPVYDMVLSVGTNPTFHNVSKSIETHIIHQFSGDFYGSLLKIVIAGFIREQKEFCSLEELKHAIAADIDYAETELQKPDYLVLKSHSFFTKNGEVPVLENTDLLLRIYADCSSTTIEPPKL